ncbi:MAG: O-antigen ligase family protein [Clostridia bacterium]|nr:O-antigen ligase family protein [Clostridia bacterium]
MIKLISRSFTWHILTSCFNFAVSKVKSSFIINVLISFFDWVQGKITESGVYAYLGKRDFTERFAEGSLVYALLDGVWSFALKIIRAIQLFTRRIFKNSFSLYLFDWLNKKGFFSLDVYLALFMGLMFLAPHNLWNNLYAFLGAMGFFLWAVWNIASGKIKGNIKKVSLSIIVFAAAVGISTVTAYVPSDALRIALFLTASVIFAYCVYASVDTKEKLVRFLKIVLFFVALTGLYGIAQRIMGVEVDLEFVDITANEGMPGRVYSTFSNPNNFAQLLVLFMPFMVPLFLSVKTKLDKICVAGGFAVCLGALAMTYSRSGWVGFALSAVVFVCIYDKRLLIPFGILVVAAIPFLPDTIMNRIFTIGSMNDSSNSYRLYIWDSCIRMIKDYGIKGLGLGPESFRAIYPGYASPVAITAPHSHMLYMEIILEMGILGAVSFFAYIFAAVKKAAGSMRVMDKELKGYAVAGVAALSGIAFVCCAEYIWFYPRVMFAFWIVPGLLFAVARIAKMQKDNPSVS